MEGGEDGCADQQLFAKGTLVEVCSDEEGFEDAWFVATVLDPSSDPKPVCGRKKKGPAQSQTSSVYVEYRTLLSDDDDSSLLKEFVDLAFVRPIPPQDVSFGAPFELGDVVDACYSDGWWTGVITRVLEDSRYVVTFRNPPDEIAFGVAELRLHLDWVNGQWVSRGKQKTRGIMFIVESKVEVSFNTEQQEVWFPGTVLEDLRNDSFLVEYQSLGNGDAAVIQKVPVDGSHIRPSPPLREENYFLLQKVDALYNYGWWSGVITKELHDNIYVVFFKHINKEREFSRTELRPHLDWKNGEWFGTSKDNHIIALGKRKGRPEKFQIKRLQPQPLAGKQGNPLANFPEQLAKEENNGKLDLPIIEDHNERRFSKCKKPPQFHSEESANQLSDPTVGDKIKDTQFGCGVSSAKRKRGRPRKFVVKSPPPSYKEKVAEADASKKEVKFTMDILFGNMPDDQPISKWFDRNRSSTTVDCSGVSPCRPVHQSSQISEGQEHVTAESSAIVTEGDVVPPEIPCLPFVKNIQIWKAIESMEVFRRLPQKPHFQPLMSCKEDSREGLAVGSMVTFSSLVERTSKLQLDVPRSSVEDCMETLVELEQLGFNVQVVRDRLIRLLSVKDQHEQLRKQMENANIQILEYNHKKSEIDEKIDEIDQQLRELQEKRAMMNKTRMIKDSQIRSLQSEIEEINESITNAGRDFESLAASPL